MRRCMILLLAGVMLCLAGRVTGVSGHEHTILSADSIPIVFAHEGTGEPALVFVHCWCCDKRYWKHQARHFAEKHTVVALDLAGHGKSGTKRERYTMDAFGADVVSVVEALDLENVVLIGHSMGGPVVLAAARRMPDRVIGIVGVDTYQSLGVPLPPERQKQLVAPFKADFEGMTRTFVRMMFVPGSDSALVAWVVDDMSSSPPEVGVSAMENMFAFDAQAALDEIIAPIYAINSDKYPTNIEAGKKAAHSFEVKFMKGYGHFIQMEEPGEFNRILGEVIEILTGS